MSKRLVVFTCPYCGENFTIELTRKPFDCPGCKKLLQFPATDTENEQRRAFDEIFNMPLDKKK